jgi:chemotaxis protein MotB
MRLSRNPEEEDDSATTFWLITYSDMVTLLVAFFLLIYSFTIMNTKEASALVHALNKVMGGGEVAAENRIDVVETAIEIANIMGKGEAVVRATETEVSIVLPSSVTFASGDATLTANAATRLAEAVSRLAAVPGVIRIEGHTDDVPITGAVFPTNWHLSAARAQSVLKLLLAAGMDPSHVEVVGYGDTRPRASNETPEGRAANRRIEIKLLRERRE